MTMDKYLLFFSHHIEATVYIYSVTGCVKTNYLQENIFKDYKDDYVRMV